ncbi:MAG: phage tail tape measure protein, partial [Planctomycetaceae bacterium]
MAASAKGIRAGKAFVELFADDSKLVRGLRSAQRRLRAFGRSVTQMGRRMAVASIATLAPIAVATKIFAGFSDQMAKVKAVTGASAGAFESLTARAKELGRTTSFTASQVAGAMVELGRAGFKPKAILNSIAGVLDLARATDTELPRAAEIAGAALRGFSLDSTEAGRVADVLTATANNSSQGLEDIGEALKVVAPIAVEAGESLEDTAAALGVLANNGIKGSLAGNSVARAYKNLSTSKAQKLLRSVGVEAVDSSG